MLAADNQSRENQSKNLEFQTPTLRTRAGVWIYVHRPARTVWMAGDVTVFWQRAGCISAPFNNHRCTFKQETSSYPRLEITQGLSQEKAISCLRFKEAHLEHINVAVISLPTATLLLSLSVHPIFIWYSITIYSDAPIVTEKCSRWECMFTWLHHPLDLEDHPQHIEKTHTLEII